jgi:hypothetical protein
MYFKRHIYTHLVMGAIIAGQFPHISHFFYFLKDIQAFFSFKDKQDGVGFLNVESTL